MDLPSNTEYTGSFGNFYNLLDDLFFFQEWQAAICSSDVALAKVQPVSRDSEQAILTTAHKALLSFSSTAVSDASMACCLI
jgi:hypothetical protein